MKTTRLEGESAKAYEAWRCYAEMEGKRSAEKVAAALKKDVSLIKRWSAKWKWTERIVQWDLEAADRREAAEKQAELEAARARQKRQEEVQEQAFTMFRNLMKKAGEMLQFPVGKQTTTKNGGKTTIIVEPVRWRFSDLARIASVADTLGRLASGLATNRSEHTGPDGEPLPVPLVQPAEIVVTVDQGPASDVPPEKIIRLKTGAA